MEKKDGRRLLKEAREEHPKIQEKQMAQETRGGGGEEEKIKEVVEEETTTTTMEAGGPSPRFKLNVHAPEFVPRSHLPAVATAPSSLPGCFYPYLQFFNGGGGGGGGSLGPEWFYFADQESTHFVPDFYGKGAAAASHAKNSSDLTQKIVKQVEYQFSDTNLVANDFLMKIMNKDPEGYVPMSVVASWKKIKALDVNNYTLIKALKTSSKLVLSEDGKKIKRKQLFTERDKEELQSRTVVVENLPEDYSRQNLEKIFSVAGCVKNIRICHPQEPNSARSSKNDVLISNKLHALVEYESTDQAEKAVEKLNDERNWRKGLRVRTMLRCSPKSVIRNKKLDFDHFDIFSDDEQSSSSQTLGSPRGDQAPDHSNEESQNGGARKGWGRVRGKVLGQAGGGGLAVEITSKPGCPPSPRMPDGTRGFTMGRGKPSPATTLAPVGP
ncbi:la-related protein 6C-like [Curcuma longa]|uniref:la-related protein 6C-like n=1 Tax=Curcuma longa TaxID=136217 RepID=UPI003D9F785A